MLRAYTELMSKQHSKSRKRNAMTPQKHRKKIKIVRKKKQKKNTEKISCDNDDNTNTSVSENTIKEDDIDDIKHDGPLEIDEIRPQFEITKMDDVDKIVQCIKNIPNNIRRQYKKELSIYSKEQGIGALEIVPRKLSPINTTDDTIYQSFSNIDWPKNNNNTTILCRKQQKHQKEKNQQKIKNNNTIEYTDTICEYYSKIIHGYKDIFSIYDNSYISLRTISLIHIINHILMSITWIRYNNKIRYRKFQNIREKKQADKGNLLNTINIDSSEFYDRYLHIKLNSKGMKTKLLNDKERWQYKLKEKEKLLDERKKIDIKLQDNNVNSNEITISEARNRINAIDSNNNNKSKQHIYIKEQDQGFTKPKVQIITPFKATGLDIVLQLQDQMPPLEDYDNTIQNLPKNRIINLHRQKKEQDIYDNNKENIIKTKQQSRISNESYDYKKLFSGNMEDHFILGIQQKRNTITLYSELYDSDIIITSPLGMKMLKNKKKELSNQFFSSIDILQLDQLHLMMVIQNFQHLQDALDMLNHIPSNVQNITNFTRIHDYIYNGISLVYRQNIFLSGYSNSQMYALYTNYCHNYRGIFRIRPRIYIGEQDKLIDYNIKQIFIRIPSCTLDISMDDIYNKRYEYFIDQWLPKIRDISSNENTLIFVSSYFTYIRLRQYLEENYDQISSCICEYSKQSKITSSRHNFVNNKITLLLYTERQHFYRRYRLNGIKHIVWYELPMQSFFYSELLSMIQISGTYTPTSLAFFTYHDSMALERIVGTSHSHHMLTSTESSFTVQGKCL